MTFKKGFCHSILGGETESLQEREAKGEKEKGR